MPTETDQTPEEAFLEWVDKNPLRRWRHAKKISIMRAAVALDVTMTTIQVWERGSATPSEENMAKLEEVVGNGTSRAWTRWANKQPEVV